jgi:tRNA-binding EMAP/Myf-like protein
MGGKQICILANLQPLTIRGIESKGMILRHAEVSQNVVAAVFAKKRPFLLRDDNVSHPTASSRRK